MKKVMIPASVAQLAEITSEYQNDNEELVLYIENTGKLYKQITLPIIENLAKKMAKGKFDNELSLKLWSRLADEGAKAYCKEFGSGMVWHKMFSKECRLKVAKSLRSNYKDAVKDKSKELKAKMKASCEVTAEEDKEYYLRKIDSNKVKIKDVLSRLAKKNGYKGQRDAFVKLTTDLGKDFCKNYNGGWNNKLVQVLERYGFEEAKLERENTYDNHDGTKSIVVTFNAKVYRGRSVNGNKVYKVFPFDISITDDPHFKNAGYFQLF